MKGIILAGGTGSRLRPLTQVTNKHLLPVYDRPMIHYPIQRLLDAGLDEILIVTGGEHADDFLRLLKDGRELGVRRLSYVHQAGNGGIAEALLLAEAFAEGEQVCVMLGDNLIEGSLRPAAASFAAQPRGAKLLLKEVDDPQRFGVAAFDDDGRISRIVEKPAQPPSRFAVTGIYFYGADVFEICRQVTPSARGEREITTVNNHYLQRGELSYEILDGWWTDAGTFESLYRASTLVRAARAAERSVPSPTPGKERG